MLLITVTGKLDHTLALPLVLMISRGGRVVLAIHRCRKPTIAAMQGSAVGVGMTMTLPAMIR